MRLIVRETMRATVRVLERFELGSPGTSSNHDDGNSTRLRMLLFFVDYYQNHCQNFMQQ